MEKEYFNIAKRKYLEGKFDEALEYLLLCEDINPDYYKAEYLLGNIYYKQGKYTEAKQKYLHCYDIKPDGYEALLKLSTCFNELNDKENELKYLKIAKEIENVPSEKKKDLYLFLGNYYYENMEYEKALKEYDKIDNPNIDQKFSRARALNQLGKQKEADAIINELIEENPNSSTVYENKSLIEKDREKYELALNSIRIAISKFNTSSEKLKPLTLDYYKIDEALYLYHGKKYKEAIEKCESFIEEKKLEKKEFLSKLEGTFYYVLAASKRMLKDEKKYLYYMERYKLGSRKDEAEYFNEMGSYYASNNNLSKYKEFVEKALKVNPNYGPAILNKYSLLSKTRNAETEEFYKKNQKAISSFLAKYNKNIKKTFIEETINFSNNYDPVPYFLSDSKILIGKGGFGEVYKEIISGKVYAAKYFTKDEKDNNEFSELYNEVHNLSVLQHDNIIKLKGFLENKLLMEYAEGGNLRNLINKAEEENKILPMKFIVEILFKTANALKYLKDKGVIHKDIKGSNILLDKIFNWKRPYPNPKICDFGLKGFTLNFSAPEVLKNEPSFKSDVFSFGMMIYEILAKESPFSGESKEYIKKKILAGEQPDFKKIQDKYYNKDLIELIKSCIIFNEEDRLSIEDVIKKLKELNVQIENEQSE